MEIPAIVRAINTGYCIELHVREEHLDIPGCQPRSVSVSRESEAMSLDRVHQSVGSFSLFGKPLMICVFLSSLLSHLSLTTLSLLSLTGFILLTESPCREEQILKSSCGN